MNRWMIALRTGLRRAGLTPIIGKVLNQLGIFGGGSEYEEKFSEAMLAELRPGDVVWEIGANLGVYTTRFCEIVGPSGHVVAFEPTPACFADLTANCSKELEANCECHQLALGNASGTVRMLLADDVLGATHSVVTGEQAEQAGGGTVEVEMVTGDALVAERGIRPPSFLKVDVEGSELDVFEGMKAVLARPECRAVFCEVHFGLLAERGQPYAAKDIEALLRASGLTDQRWVDASHLVALRPG